MSQSSKKEETKVGEVFTISLEDSGKMPGVTMLINPQKMKAEVEKRAKTAQIENAAASTPPAASTPGEIHIELDASPAPAVVVSNAGSVSAPASVSSTVSSTAASPAAPAAAQSASLESFGVQFTLFFEDKTETAQRYSKCVPHSGQNLAPWQQELFNKMKFVPEIFLGSEDFQEHAEGSVAFEAVGAEPGQWVQAVRLGNAKRFFLHVSKQSLAPRKGEFLAFLKQNDTDQTAPISLQRAA